MEAVMLKTALAWSVVDDEMSKAQSPLPSKRNYQDASFSSSEIPLVFYYLPSFSVYVAKYVVTMRKLKSV